jgi:zinc-binding alcohol dehydrogenase/oxidoreductase
MPQPSRTSMLASVLNTGRDDPPVSVQQWPVPELQPGWVLIRVVRAALNRLDEMTVAERCELPDPAVIGSDAAGVVVAVGEGVTNSSIGDEVVVSPSLWWGDDQAVQGDQMEILGYPVQGTHAEFVTVPAENVLPKPVRLSWEQAAALPMAGVTAWRALVTRGQLKAGETVVITAASSGVGSLAIQIASGLGARVIAVSSSPDKLEHAKRLGAEAAVLRGGDDFADRLQQAAAGAHLVIDPAGANWPALVQSLRPGGRLVVLGRKAADMAQLPIRIMFWRQLSVMGTSMGSPADFAALLRHLEAACWAPVIDSVYPLGDVAAAYRRLDDPARFGKVLLSMSAE